MTTRLYDPIDIARQFLFVRESSVQNHGLRVGGIQFWCGGQDLIGTSWCAEFLTMVLDICYQGNAPIPRQGSCEEIRQLAMTKAWITQTPVHGDVYLRVKDGLAHHCGFFVDGTPQTGQFRSISGNTNDDGSSNGNGVYEDSVISLGGDVFIHLPLFI